MDLARLERQARSVRFPTLDAIRELRPGRHRTRQRGHGFVFADTREYQYGDDIRNLDWNATARLGKPYVKVFDQERGAGVLLVLDLSASLLAGTTGIRKTSLMREVAVLFALAAQHQGERLGALFFTDRAERIIPPRRGRAHTQAVVRNLQDWQPVNPGTSLNAALNAARKTMRRRGLVIVLSDFLGSSYSVAMRALGATHQVLPLCLKDPAEMSFPDAGLVSLCDPETGATRVVDTSNRVVRHAFERKWAEMDARRQNTFRELGLPALDLVVGRSYLPLFNAYADRSGR